MLIPVVGLLLLENLFRNSDRDTRWATKHLCIAMGIIFTYDFFYFADAMFFGRPNPTLYGVRGFVSAMMVPLIVLGVARSRTWPVAIHLSRQVVFHSFALVGSGLYLLTMGAVGFYLRRIEGEWGPALQIVFLIGAASILAVIFASGSLRARAKLFISRNFFSLKYDYRQTWMQFRRCFVINEPRVGPPASSPQCRVRLDGQHGRRSLDPIRRRRQHIFPAYHRTWAMPCQQSHWGRRSSAGSISARWLSSLRRPPIGRRYPNLQIPEWLRTLTRAWLVIPLIHRDLLQGFIVLGESRTASTA